jgi:hypothetical protein
MTAESPAQLASLCLGHDERKEALILAIDRPSDMRKLRIKWAEGSSVSVGVGLQCKRMQAVQAKTGRAEASKAWHCSRPTKSGS